MPRCLPPQSQEDVLRSDKAVVEQACFILRQHEHTHGPLREALPPVTVGRAWMTPAAELWATAKPSSTLNSTALSATAVRRFSRIVSTPPPWRPITKPGSRSSPSPRSVGPCPRSRRPRGRHRRASTRRAPAGWPLREVSPPLGPFCHHGTTHCVATPDVITYPCGRRAREGADRPGHAYWATASRAHEPCRGTETRPRPHEGHRGIRVPQARTGNPLRSTRAPRGARAHRSSAGRRLPPPLRDHRTR